jgi:molecular chaperone GrpE
MSKNTDIADGDQAPGSAPGVAEGAPVSTPAAPAVSVEEVEELRKRAARADEHWERLLRTTADFDNYKKRAAREKQDSARAASERLLSRLIPVLDAFDMALAATQNTQAPNLESLQAGIAMVAQQLKAAVVEEGLEEVDAAGKVFDPNLHEAVSQRETADAPEGQVVQQLRKGYRFRERLLRPASVIIAKPPSA